ncbi:MAG: hypothetical protein WCJ70_03600 [bacterium]
MLYQCQYGAIWLSLCLIPVTIATYRFMVSQSDQHILRNLKISITFFTLVIGMIFTVCWFIQSDAFIQAVLFRDSDACDHTSKVLYALSATHPNNCYKKYGLCENIIHSTVINPFAAVSEPWDLSQAKWEKDLCVLKRDRFTNYEDCNQLSTKQGILLCKYKIAHSKLDLSYCFDSEIRMNPNEEYDSDSVHGIHIDYNSYDPVKFQRMFCILHIGSKITQIRDIFEPFQLSTPYTDTEYQSYLMSCQSRVDALSKNICLTRLAYDAGSPASCSLIDDNKLDMKNFCYSIGQKRKLDSY